MRACPRDRVRWPVRTPHSASQENRASEVNRTAPHHFFSKTIPVLLHSWLWFFSAEGGVGGVLVLRRSAWAAAAAASATKPEPGLGACGACARVNALRSGKSLRTSAPSPPAPDFTSTGCCACWACCAEPAAVPCPCPGSDEQVFAAQTSFCSTDRARGHAECNPRVPPRVPTRVPKRVRIRVPH